MRDKFGLSKREAEVLKLLAEGLTNSQIAQRLGTSNGTAKNHVQHILEILGVHSRVDAVNAWRAEP